MKHQVDVTLNLIADEALDAFWQVLVRRYPEALNGDLSPWATMNLKQAAMTAIEEWISNNVPPNPEDEIKCQADLNVLTTYLDNSHIKLHGFGCCVALSPDRKTIFECHMMADGTPDRDNHDPHHLNWGEVTAPEEEFIEKINQLYGTSFRMRQFAGR